MFSLIRTNRHTFSIVSITFLTLTPHTSRTSFLHLVTLFDVVFSGHKISSIYKRTKNINKVLKRQLFMNLFSNEKFTAVFQMEQKVVLLLWACASKKERERRCLCDKQAQQNVSSSLIYVI